MRATRTLEDETGFYMSLAMPVYTTDTVNTIPWTLHPAPQTARDFVLPSRHPLKEEENDFQRQRHGKIVKRLCRNPTEDRETQQSASAEEMEFAQ